MDLGHLSAVPPEHLLDALPVAVVVADDQGRITYANPAIRTLLGHDPALLIGRSLTKSLPQRFQPSGNGTTLRPQSVGQGELLGRTTQLPVLHADGHEVVVDLTLARLDAAPGKPADQRSIVCVLRDASATILLERQLQVSRYLTATLRVTTALTEAADADVAFQRVLPTLCTELDWDAAVLWETDDHSGRLVHAGTWTAPGEEVAALRSETRRTFGRGEGLPGLVRAGRAPVVIEDLWTDPRFLRGAAAGADDVRTGVAFPVLHGESVLGVCELFSHEQRTVPPELVEVLAHAGRQIGQFLGRLRAESEVRGLAETLQRSLLPSHLPTVPGVDLAAHYRAGGGSALVGGDTYDVMPLPDGRWMALVADVCGTGAEAAALTALTRHTARAASAAGCPAAVLAAINTALLHEQATGPLRFVTACCLVLERGPRGHRVGISIAGHPPPLLRTADGAVVALGRPAAPLGVDPDTVYSAHPVDLPAGSMLLLYTDGVTEARDTAGEQFGEDALQELLRHDRCADAEVAVAAVAAAVEDQVSGSRYEADDMALLALGVPG
ncbi:SpoIIE family protein phosphatase [Blastococcus sp. CCUG 61487]|uniref:SpoIIE family protein phosphatase n=1 Tax=Blastococcus sp. CCUG 61487 TaxID=1840703 RepID=UPI0010C12F6D|nr:SpoIIE family protein phosphatase [Blastococcus sp. CCUG 61487]TKJ19043.1 histidine kinase [Blastococcus sp. CCUG 61487]